MKAFLCVGLVLALLSTATCLKCLQCLQDKETCDDTRIQECKPEEDACLSGITNITLYGEKVISSFKACFQSKRCHQGYTSTTFGNNMYSQSNISCCQTDLCNSENAKLPPRIATPNGLQCPSCYANNSDHCRSKETVGCAHHENRCLAFTYSVTAGSHSHTAALQGCTTEITCATHVGVFKIADGLHTDITRVDCSPATEQSN